MDLRYPTWFSIYTIIDMFVNGLFTCENRLGLPQIQLRWKSIFQRLKQKCLHKYIVDIVADLPLLLSQLNNRGGIVKTYIYVYPTRRANSHIIAQHFDLEIVYVIDPWVDLSFKILMFWFRICWLQLEQFIV